MILFNQEPEITIVKSEMDERGKKKAQTYDVYYEILGIEIEGKLIPYESGRETAYKFEEAYFEDKQSEEYFDNNWEDIEKQILDKFNIMK